MGKEVLLFHVVLISDLANNLLDNILHGDDARRSPILIDNDRKVGFLAPEFVEEVPNSLGLRNEVRGPAKVLDCKFLFFVEPQREQILGVDNADDVVKVLSVNRDSGMAGLNDGLQELLLRAIVSHGDNMDSGNHDFASDGLLQLENALDHVAFVMIDEASLFTFVDDLLDVRGAPFPSHLPGQPAPHTRLSLRL